MPVIPLSTMLSNAALSSLLIAVLGICCLIFTTIKQHTRTGPKLKDTIEQHYKGYAIRALARLALWSGVILFCISFLGSLHFLSISLLLGLDFSLFNAFIAGALSSLIITAYLFCHHLFHTPSLIFLSAQFRFSRLDPLWRRLSAKRLRTVRQIALASSGTLLICLHLTLNINEYFYFLVTLDLSLILSAIFLVISFRGSETNYRTNDTSSRSSHDQANSPPNIIMIGCDTLRADHLGVAGYHRDITPQIDKLATSGFSFTNCYVPLARTAPSLTSLLTGCWPHTHKIRSNYPFASNLKLPVPSFAKLLTDAGYNTAAVGDWAAADLDKIDFGFQDTELPRDQWNMKYLIRQGSAFIRLFLSLYTHNRFGKKILPEIYYLAGIPLTQQTGRECRELISRYSKDSKPFFINYFSSSAHVPFGSNYPYYQLFTDNHYKGESRFLMTSLASPEEIIEKQGLSTDDFDVPQIINLYDGCIRQFDDEVGKINEHLKHCGLDKNTIIVIYSDHGADFFENGCWGQGNSLLGDDPSNRIPMIIQDPRHTSGITFKHTVNSIDIAPTLLDMIGLEKPSSIEGISLAPWFTEPDLACQHPSFQETGVWLGKIPGMRPDHITYPDLLEVMDIPDKDLSMLTIKQHYYLDIIKAKDRCIRDNEWKLIYFPTTKGIDYQLFNIKNDPQCKKNVASKHPDVLFSYKKLLDEWIHSDLLMEQTVK